MRKRTATPTIAAALLCAALPAALAGSATALGGPEDAPERTTATVQAVWNMVPSSGVVRDTASGLSLALHGTYTASGGSVWFGSAVPSFGSSNDNGRLSPGTQDFAVAAVFSSVSVPRGQGYSPNVVQKGLAGRHAQWKLTLAATDVGTLAQCRFEGSGGRALVRDGSRTRIDNGQAHTVACWRSGSALGITVDGRHTTASRTIGSIAPRSATTVANKNAQGGVEDQLKGWVGCVTYAVGTGARDAALSRVGC